jgi:hypothetical protein
MRRPKSKRLLEAVANALGALPGVYSTPQWGGRAYKLPGPRNDRRKPRLLAHVCVTRDATAVSVEFKLPKDRAVKAARSLGWISPHPYATLAQSGWVSAHVTSARQMVRLRSLLAESRALHPPTEIFDPGSRLIDAGSSPESRIHRVMTEAATSGWMPPEKAEGFECGRQGPMATKRPPKRLTSQR